MNKKIVKFLEFKGKNIVYLSVDGTYWLAIKPVCDAINVDYIQQYKNVREDEILRPRLCKHTILLPGDTQPRRFVCLPEELIYGWILGSQDTRTNNRQNRHAGRYDTGNTAIPVFSQQSRDVQSQKVAYVVLSR